ncbi:glycogen/starch synthase [soil metagenome]
MARRGRSGTPRKTARESTSAISSAGGSLAIGAQAADEALEEVSGTRAPEPPPQPSAAPAPAAASTAPIDSATPQSSPPDADRSQPPLLFEVGWEVCWQLGGIYTVLRSKIAAMQKRWGDRYCLIGPYNPVTAAREFDELTPDETYAGAVQDLRNQGIPVHYGRWLVPGRPRVILLDYRARFNQLDNDKYMLWKDHGISSYSSDGEVNEVVAFGMVCAEFLRLMTEHVRDRPILAHFHEWMAGVAVPRIAHLNLPIATVFTTHATLLGRYIAGENPHFYEHLPFLNPDAEAQKYNILPRFQIERAAAHASTVFTTVSEVTATEAEHLLGRTIDRLLPNGLNIQRFAAPHEFQAMHSQYKERINEFVMGHFFPAYTFDLDKTIYLFTSGRYEYRNKGMDLFIEALHQLNQRLKHVPDHPTVVAFIITRAPTRNINVGVLQNQSMFDDLRSWCNELETRMGNRLFRTAAMGKLPTFEDLINEDSMVRLKQSIHAWRNGRQPPIVTHDLLDDGNDAVLKHLRHRNLVNNADDPVKVVFHPEFVTHTSPLLSLEYEQFVRGCHMGIFPSYYEPWGYTPMETIALGLPAVTSDLSGFGAYVNRNIPDNDSDGICVLNRLTHSFDQTVESLVDHLMTFAKLNRRQRIELRNKVERVSEMFDWSQLVSRYHDAHDLALERLTAGKRAGKFELRMV